MTVLVFVVSALILWVLQSVFLLFAVKLTRNEGTFAGMMLVTGASTLLGMIPGIGALLSLVVYFILLTKFTTAPFWPDAILITVINFAIKFLLGLVVVLGLASLFGSGTPS